MLFGLVFLAVFLWSWLGVLGKMLYELRIDAFQTTALRILFAWAALFPWAIYRKWWSVKIVLLPKLFLYSLFSVVFNYLCFFLALQYITVAAATVVLYTYPVMVLVLSRVFLGEALGKKEVVALLTTLAGIFFIVQGYRLEKLVLNAAGGGLALLAAFSVAVYNVWGKRLVQHMNPWTLLFWGFTLGGSALWSAYLGSRHVFPTLTPAGWGIVLCIALFPTLGGYGIYLVAIRRIKASHASLLSTIEPLLASIWAAIFLGERLELPQIVGGIMVLSAVLLILWSRRDTT